MAEGYVVLTTEQRFTNQLIENADSNQKSVIWNREKYESILNKIKIGIKEHSSDYYHMQRFDVLHCGDVEKLIKRRQSLTDPTLYYAYAEEIYSIVMNLSETQETELDVHVCAVCENLCFSNVQCSTCAQYIHELCSKGNMSDTITCHLCSNEEIIRNERRHASDSMTKQAVRMRNLSGRVLTEVDVGANMLIPIPHVDRGKGDPRNVMAVVTGKEEHDYKLGIKDGMLRGLYTRNQFELSDSNFIAIQSVNFDNAISLRKAISMNLPNKSIYIGHDLIK